MKHKIIVFDMDHTLGYFKQFIQILNHIEIDKLNDSYDFLFDIFSEYFRPNIFHLFEYLIVKRKEKKINSIVLYTNNNNDIFINKVIEYMNHKLNENLFDIIVTPTHPKRKLKYKDYRDLLECCDLNTNSYLCFIDDKKHSNMICDRVFYIHCEPYVHSISTNEIYNRIKIRLPTNEKINYRLNLSNQKRVTDQILNRIKWFIR